jgi:hypothetical protein
VPTTTAALCQKKKGKKAHRETNYAVLKTCLFYRIYVFFYSIGFLTAIHKFWDFILTKWLLPIPPNWRPEIFLLATQICRAYFQPKPEIPHLYSLWPTSFGYMRGPSAGSQHFYGKSPFSTSTARQIFPNPIG